MPPFKQIKMFAEFLNIIVRSLKLDKTLYKENKYFEHEAGIYFAISIIILTALVGLIPHKAILNFFSPYVGELEPPRLLMVVIGSGIAWLLRSLYLFLVVLILFPNNKIKKIFIKTLIAVGFAHAPFLFNLLILDFKLIYLTFVIYIWYNATLVVGINQIYQFNNILKSTIIVIAPYLIFVIYILYLMSNNPNGTIS